MIAATRHSPHLQHWLDWIAAGHDPAGLASQLAEDAVFTSPIVHTPQRGKLACFLYLSAAGETLGNDSFRYTRIFDCGQRAVLEFETEMDGITVNGVDMIEWNGDGQITDFKVMVRPLKAVNKCHEAMARMLEKMKSGA